MERLTRNYPEHAAVLCDNCDKEYESCDASDCLRVVAKRLADIEDILGDTYDLDRLRELIAADRAGKAMILPVKPGEYIYLISLDSEIVPCRVGNIAAEEWGTSFEGYVNGFGAYRTGPNDKVFFSRMEAVNALKREVDHE